MTDARPSLAVWKFSSCDGCQLSLLDCEDELLELAGAVHINHFLEASSRVARGPYDVSLVEGSITTDEDRRRIAHVREISRTLVTIGACATAGGIQALRNFAGVDELAAAVYPRPGQLRVLATSTGIADHVPVDLELRGCPVSRSLLLDVLTALLAGRRPRIPRHPVCMECRAAGNACVLVEQGTPCLGPVTRAGCAALCPGIGRGCFGCQGPSESANVGSLETALRAAGATERDTVRLLRTFNAWAPAFRDAGWRIESRREP